MNSKYKKNNYIILLEFFALISVLSFLNLSHAYESELFFEIDYFNPKFHKEYVDYNMYDISGNPAFYSQAYTKNLNLYQISANRKLNNYHRYFDAEQNDNMAFNLQWIRQLSKKSTLATGITYYQNNQKNLERSLEKNYYNHYFSFTDTTIGNVVYKGPKLWVLYDYSINKNILLGLALNYRVERGLKDVYTECETIIRDIDINLGIGYLSNSKNTQIGLSTRYFNRQAMYEAVKEYLEAVNNTWFGYHLFLSENPRATNRKNDYREGYEVGIQLEQNHILGSDFGIRLSGNFGEFKNKIKVGSPSNTQPRGYWQRSAYQILTNLYYQTKKINSQLYMIYNNYSDWAKPKDYNVLILENSDIQNRIGWINKLFLLEKFQIDLGFELSTINTYYEEFAAEFLYNEIRKSNFFMGGGKFKINPISSFYLHGNIGSVEPDFHWPDTNKFNIMGIKLGYERQFLFGNIDFCLNYNILTPDNVDKKNEEFGIEIYFLQ